MARGGAPARLNGPASAPEGSILVWFGAMGVLTLSAIAAGALLGFGLSGGIEKAPVVGGVGSLSDTAPKYAGGAVLRELPPIIANLAEPADAWVRLQAAIVFDGTTTPKPDVDAARIAEDFLGFLRTLSIAQIGGASGLQHLREDLSERAAIRTDGRVRELVIQALVVQ